MNILDGLNNKKDGLKIYSDIVNTQTKELNEMKDKLFVFVCDYVKNNLKTNNKDDKHIYDYDCFLELVEQDDVYNEEDCGTTYTLCGNQIFNGMFDDEKTTYLPCGNKDIIITTIEDFNEFLNLDLDLVTIEDVEIVYYGDYVYLEFIGREYYLFNINILLHKDILKNV